MLDTKQKKINAVKFFNILNNLFFNLV